jgi:hypothetical protein
VLIKMDIEGSEIRVLDHLTAALPEQCFMFIELHDGEQSARWMQSWAEQNGFTFVEVRRRDEAIDGYLLRARPAPPKPVRPRGEELCLAAEGGVA